MLLVPVFFKQRAHLLSRHLMPASVCDPRCTVVIVVRRIEIAAGTPGSQRRFRAWHKLHVVEVGAAGSYAAAKLGSYGRSVASAHRTLLLARLWASFTRPIAPSGCVCSALACLRHCRLRR